MGTAIPALRCHERDNVAVLFSEDGKAGARITVRDRDGRGTELTLRQDIPYGHKIAVRAIRPGEAVLKYGEEIGAATAEIRAGEHVHVHNMESRRGRGDWDNRTGGD